MTDLPSYITIYKNVGETPLEALRKARILHNIAPEVAMTYAGRLDPMAEGLLLLLVGEECKNREKYFALSKEYEVQILFGVSTDTGDILGIINEVNLEKKNIGENEEIIKEVLKKCSGKFTQTYPMYSSKTVGGKPLFSYARSGEEPEEMPTKEVEIYSIEILERNEVTLRSLLENIEEKIQKVKGDFRQSEALQSWRSLKESSLLEKSLPVLKIKVSASSGVYMRSLAERVGKELSLPALALSIKRTRVGEISL